MTFSFHDKVVVITGAAKGIGAATARLFDQSGAIVIGLDIDAGAAKVFAGQHPQARFYACDVSQALAVKRSFHDIEQHYDKIDILVNNAGIQSHGRVADMEEEVWDRTLDTNLKSAFLCSKYSIPLMKSSAAPVIVNIASVQALVCEENASAYIASKAGMLGLTKAIAIDYAPHIRCVALCPGAVNTEMVKNDLLQSDDPEKFMNDTRNIHLVKKIAEPEDVAFFIAFLASERAGFCTGEYYRMDGGIGAKIVLQ